MADAATDEVEVNVGVLGRIVKGAVRRGTTVREALTKFGFGGRLREREEIHGWLRGDGSKPKSMKLDDPIETDMTVLRLAPIIGGAPLKEDAKRVARTRKIIDQVVREQLPKDGARDILLQPFDNFDGEDALRVTIVMDPVAAATFDAFSPLDLLVELRRRLEEDGETRFPIIEYFTRGDIERNAIPG